MSAHPSSRRRPRRASQLVTATGLFLGFALLAPDAGALCTDPTLFTGQTSFACGLSPHGIAVGDFNEDGVLDLATANSGAFEFPSNGNVGVLLGNGSAGTGDGSFGPSGLFPAGTSPFDVATADFDEDGILDLLTANLLSNNVSFLRGQGVGGVGDGTFAAPLHFPAGPGPFRLAVGDFNEDGILDVAVANNTAPMVSVLRGLGSGGVGNGSFGSLTQYAIADLSTGIVAADFNEDGILDLAATCNYSGVVAILRGDGSAGNGNGAFLPAVHFPANTEPFVLATADMNGDGITDLLAGDAGFNGLAILLGNGSAGIGDGTFGPAVIFNDNRQNAGIVTGDFDQDGDVDVATADGRAFEVSVMRGTGAGGLDPATRFPVGLVSFPMNGGDFNEDGLLDLVTANLGEGTVSVLLGTCAAGPPPPPSNAPVLTRVRDVPNDQGGLVFVTWARSRLDIPGRREIVGYRIWRRVPPEEVASLPTGFERDRREGFELASTIGFGGLVTYWEALATLPAQQLEGYGYTAATTQDSMQSGNPYAAFFVSALTPDPFVFYSSNVDSGYSVDNLPPDRPRELQGNLRPEGYSLEWKPNEEADLAGYRLYRGAAVDFPIDEAHRIADPLESPHVDVGANGDSYYKLSAVDEHGNESEVVSLSPYGSIDAGDAGPDLALLGTFPHPSSGSGVVVGFTLPGTGEATIEILDARGRRLLVREVGSMGPGSHRVDLSQGRRIPAGVYLLRLIRGGMNRSMKLVLVP